MKTNRRKLTGRQRQWLSHLRRAQARKQPLTQYCRAHGLSVQSLYNVRHELAEKGQRPAATRPAPKKSRAASRFVAIRVASRPAAISGATCRLHLKDVVIECASLPSPAWLAELARGAAHAVP
jgi:hypothetical protein